jgi:hypothetical protein
MVKIHAEEAGSKGRGRNKGPTGRGGNFCGIIAIEIELTIPGLRKEV